MKHAQSMFAFVSACVGCTAAVCSASAPTQGVQNSAVTVAFERDARVDPIITVKLSNGTSGRFLIDSGTDACLISDTFAKAGHCALKKLPTGTRTVVPCTGYVDGLKTNLDGLHQPPSFYVVPHDILQRMDRQPIDGVIGCTWLAERAVLFDFPARRLVIWNSGRLDQSALAAAHMDSSSTTRVSLSPNDRHVYTVDAAIDGAERTAMVVDTGAEITVIPESLVHNLGLEPVRTGGTANDLAGGQAIDEFSLPSLRLAGAESLDIVAISFHGAPPVLSDNALGRSILARYAVLLDFAGGTAFFRPPGVGDTNAASAASTARYMWRLKHAATDTFVVQQTVTITEPTPTDIRHSSTQTDIHTYSVRQVTRAGDIVFDVASKNLGMVVDGAETPPDPSFDRTVHMRYSPTGALISAEIEVDRPAELNELAHFQDWLAPPHPVAKGEVWQAPVSSRVYPGTPIEVTFRLADVTSVAGRTLVTVHESGTMEFGAEAPPVQFDGHYTVDSADGHLVEQTVNFSNVAMTSSTQLGQTVYGTVTIKDQVVPANSTEKAH